MEYTSEILSIICILLYQLYYGHARLPFETQHTFPLWINLQIYKNWTIQLSLHPPCAFDWIHDASSSIILLHVRLLSNRELTRRQLPYLFKTLPKTKQNTMMTSVAFQFQEGDQKSCRRERDSHDLNTDPINLYKFTTCSRSTYCSSNSYYKWPGEINTFSLDHLYINRFMKTKQVYPYVWFRVTMADNVGVLLHQ